MWLCTVRLDVVWYTFSGLHAQKDNLYLYYKNKNKSDRSTSFSTLLTGFTESGIQNHVCLIKWQRNYVWSIKLYVIRMQSKFPKHGIA